MIAACTKEDADAIGKLHENFIDLFEQKTTMNSRIANAANTTFKPKEPIYEFFVMLIESIAYELNIEKPDHDKVTSV